MADDFARFESALKAASDAGDAEGARQLATEMRRMLERQVGPQVQKPFPIGQEGMPAALAAVAKDEGVATQRLAGIGSAPMVAYHAGAELLGANNAADVQNWKGVSSASPDTTMGNMAGNALMFGAAPAGGVAAAAPMIGIKTLPRWAQVADMAATQGGLAAATTPGGSEERLISGLIGGAGAGVPGAVGVVQTGRRMTTQAGKQLDVAEGLRRELGADTDPLVAALNNRSSYPTSGIGVNPSAAMLTRNPILETMETGSRVKAGDQWTNFDRMNASARWKALEDAAGSPEDLVRMRAARDVFTTPMRDEALGATGGALKVGAGTSYAGLNEKLAELAGGANRPNAAVQTMVNFVKGELDNGVSPEQLYTVRKMLTDGIAAAPTAELSQAARAARPQRMELIGMIDNTLNDISRGGWEKYLESYKLASPMISSKGALQKMTDALTYGREAGAVPASMGEQAAPYALGKLNERFGSKTFGSKEFDQLTPQHRQLVDSLISDLTAQAGTMKSRSTLGSPTAPHLANAGRVNQLTNSMIDAAGNVIPYAGNAIASSVKGSAARLSEESLARMLQDPEILAKALQDAARSQALLTKSGRAGAAADAAAR